MTFILKLTNDFRYFGVIIYKCKSHANYIMKIIPLKMNYFHRCRRYFPIQIQNILL